MQVVQWWEGRRLLFNLIVGGTGLLTCLLMIICAVISDSMVGEAIGLPDGPLLGVFGILLYGILANVFYTSGWICELLLRSLTTPERSTSLGLKAFRFGIRFSAALTILPALLCWTVFAIALIHGQKQGPSVE